MQETGLWCFLAPQTHKMLSEGLTTGPKFLLKHTDPSPAALLHKGRCRPGQLTQAAVKGWASTLLLLPSWQGAGPFPQPNTDLDTSRCHALSTVVLKGSAEDHVNVPRKMSEELVLNHRDL